ncbi:hypothetical protein GCM10010345_19240 [Streptomyces canarius]|uniref:Uncharacterized protein n=1 Tax=Streptomyces canarius TaxID=285453 RepID=A0ABQ3CHI0_9ACTN|nr:hypothetical protein GCM10010345_19240 [Streptomyces canarius]
MAGAQPEPVQQIAGVRVQPAHPRLASVDRGGAHGVFWGVLLAGDGGLPGPGLRPEAGRTYVLPHSMPHGPVGNNY